MSKIFFTPSFSILVVSIRMFSLILFSWMNQHSLSLYLQQFFSAFLHFSTFSLCAVFVLHQFCFYLENIVTKVALKLRDGLIYAQLVNEPTSVLEVASSFIKINTLGNFVWMLSLSVNHYVVFSLKTFFTIVTIKIRALSQIR